MSKFDKIKYNKFIDWFKDQPIGNLPKLESISNRLDMAPETLKGYLFNLSEMHYIDIILDGVTGNIKFYKKIKEI